MNVLVTGGAGFIGSHLAERLLGRGENVCVVDDFSAQASQNIQRFENAPNFQFVRGTVTDRELMAEQIDAADVIYHLAATVGVELVVESPTRAIETNIHGTEVILELAARGKKRVLITSTS